MTFTPRQMFLDSAAYDAARYAFIKQVEEAGNVSLTAYIDTKGIPTIGLGFNLRANLSAVMRSLGISLTSKADAKYRTRISSIVYGTYVDSEADEQRLRDDLNDVMSDRAADAAVGGSKRATFAFADEAEITQTFVRIAEAIYDAKILAWEKKYGLVAADATKSSIPLSPELIAIFSLAYNSKDDPSRTLLGPGLANAIMTGNRAAAWYEIRYNSNLNQERGVAKRRYLESEVFGLYAAEGNVTELEGRQTYEMLTAHRTQILSAEARWGVAADGARGTSIDGGHTPLELAQQDDDNLGAFLDDGTVNTLAQNLEPARNAFIAWLNGQLPVGVSSLVASDWNPAAIYYTPGTAAQTAAGFISITNATDGDGKGGSVEHNLENNILVGGDGVDVLTGGAGQDVLFGAGGADEIRGGTGDDILYGGVGDDIYIWNAGDGNDTIIDPDGGTLVINDGFGMCYSLRGTFIHQPGEGNVWTDASGDLVLTHNSPWRLELANGAVIQLGENFDPSAWGITLQDQPDEPTSTLAGDLIKATSGSTYVTNANGYDSAGFQADAQDVINGGVASETIQGLGGNDGLAGGDGDDVIDGGAGNDLILGGWGADSISGGDGNDEILGSAFGLIDRPSSTTFTPPSAAGLEIARGFSWVIYDPADGSSYIVAGTTGIAPNGEAMGNIIDGGAGNDRIGAGSGPDIAHGGADDDVVVGMGGDDVLFGDAGADRIWGDGFGNYASGWYTPYSEHGNDVLDGGTGDDVLVGQGGNDMLFGGANDDQLIGDDTDEARTPFTSHGDDYLDGGEGNDHLVGDGGNDDLYGGEGNDILTGDAAGIPLEYQGDDYLDGGAGDDILNGYGKNDVLMGGDGNDVLSGDSSDTPDSYHGDDYLDGGTGADTLIGAGGADTLFGGDGNDTLGGDADNVASEFHGDDYLDGGAGDDYLRGYGGNDTLFGGTGDDELHGETGDDTLAGGAGVDSMYGGAGDDTYVFALGDAVRNAQNESDTISDAEGSNVVQIEGVASTDISLELSANGQVLVLNYGSNEGIAVALGSTVNFSLDDGEFTFAELVGGLNDGTLAFSDGVWTYQVGDSADNLLASTGSTTLSGGRGNDMLTGTGGLNTYLYSVGDGTDTITDTSPKVDSYGTPIPNTLSFGSWITADDLRLGVEGTALTISVGWDPNDKIVIEGFNAADALNSHPIDRFTFSNGTVLTYAELLARGFDIAGTSGNDTLVGTSVDDRIDGGAGNDTLSGGTGSDTYYWGTGSGQDLIDNTDASGPKTDTLWIGSGLAPQDLVFARNGNDLVVRMRAGSDTVTVLNHFAGAAIDQVLFEDGTLWDVAAITAYLSNELTAGNDVYTGTGGDDYIEALGGNDTVNGVAGNDVIDGGDGDDTLHGGDGDDALWGGSGADTLYGDAGADTLVGGAGDDNLFGGAGADVYRFGRGSGSDWLQEGGDAGTVDVIRLADDIALSDVSLGRSGNDLVIKINGTSDQLTVSGVWAVGASDVQRIERIEFADGTTWTEAEIRARVLQDAATSANDSVDGFDGADVLHGLGGNDSLRGGDGADQIHGDDGNDTLLGQNGDDVLDGGAGDDRLYGGAGSDTILFGRGMGTDTLYSDDSAPASIDRVIFAGDVSVGDTELGHSTENELWLVVTTPGMAGNDGSVYMPQFFANDGAASVDEVRFADGTVWTYADIKARLLAGTNDANTIVGFGTGDTIDGLGGDDYIDGFSGADTLAGGAGNDRVYGSAGNDSLAGDAGDDQLDGGDGNDTLYGGTGIDTMTGGLGDDVYRFGRGDGSDTIHEESGTGSGTDAIELAAGILPAAVSLYRNGVDLVLVLDGGATQLKVANFFGSTPTQIEQIRFADSTVWDLAAINARVVSGLVNAMTGTAGNDTFVVDNTLDTIVEAAGQGTDTVMSSVDWTLGANLENLTLTGVLNATGRGNDLANVLVGNDGDNHLWSGTDYASDTLRGGKGDDTYHVTGSEDLVVELAGEGLDTVVTDNSYALPDYVENLTYSGAYSWVSGGVRLTGNALANVIDGRANTAVKYIDGGAGADVMMGPANTTKIYYVDNPGDVVIDLGSLGGDVIATTVDYALPATTFNGALPSGVERLDLVAGSSATTGTGNALDNVLRGNERDNLLYGLAGNDVFYAGYGADTLVGGSGDDVYYLDPGATAYLDEWLNPVGYPAAWYGGTTQAGTIVEASGEGEDTVYSVFDYTLADNVENLYLRAGSYGQALRGTGNALNNVIVGNALDNVLDGGGGADMLSGGAGDDTYVVDSGDTIVEYAGEGTDMVIASASYALQAEIENLTLTGAGNDTGTGNDLDNVLDGTQSAGANQLAGGLGNDTYRLGAGDVAVEVAGEGTDTVETDVSYALGGSIENLVLTGSAATTGTGTAAADHLDGSRNAASNTLVGLGGDDQYVVDATDIVVEAAGGGNDTVTAMESYTLGANVETLVLAGATGSEGLSGTGNALDNLLVGNAGDNVLDGAAGADTMRGGDGNDTYYVDSSGDVVDETGVVNSFADQVVSSISYTLGANLEGLALTGSASIAGTGNALDNVLDGSQNSAANILTGGLGDDTYILGAGDTVVEGAGEGNDVIVSDVSYVLGSNIENLALGGSAAINATGNSVANELQGNDADNVLDGAGGADQMWGYGGNDTYIVDNTGDAVWEDPGQGTDLVKSSVTYTLSADVENLTLTGTSAINGTGNSAANVLTGNSAANVLSGGAGNDTYVVSTGDTVTEGSNAGTDTVQSDVTWTLGNNLENLTLTGTSAINGTGNTLANVLTGNSASNTLNGGSGADQMAGGAGNDTYAVDNAGDVVTENSGEGTDLVNASVTYSLGNNIENLTLTGTSAINGTGNSLDNVLTGNSGNNTLTGGAGNDTLDGGSAGTDSLVGGTGNDTYVVGRTSGITITENASEGTDLVQASVTYTLGNNLENLTLTGTSAINGTGNTLDNVLTGNSGNNTLTGGAGNDSLDGGSAGTDSLVGGAGNDTYVVGRTSGITITENASEGTDLVQASVTYTLGSNLENLTLTGSSAINGTGNTLANVLTGNSSNNTLDGGSGVDQMSGGAGNDTYIVDNAGDVVTENSAEGTDLVNASVTYSLGNNIENLTLTGTSAINGTGNSLDNVLTGNSGNNTLTGGAGNDTLDGGSAGTDSLVGGTGNDTYVVARTSGITITENASEGTDLVQASVTYTLGNNLENLTLTGTSAINGTGNTLDNVLTGNSGNNTLTGGAGNDTLDGGSAGTDSLVGGTGNDTYVVGRTSGITITENASEGIDAISASVAQTLGSNIELLFLTGTSAINGTGNTLANLLRGNAAINTLVGGGGTDILEGGDGNDILSNSSGNTLLNGGLGADTLTGAAGNDLLIGGAGNDALTTGTGADIIVFNKGDGSDSVAASTGTDNTLSLGGGTTYADLVFQKSGTDLILKIGATDQITLVGYYSGSNRSVSTLQVVIEGTSDYLPGGGDVTRDNKIESFNFSGLVAAFDAALAANPNLTSWALTNALATQYLTGSDAAAIGGDLAYRYNRFGTLSDVSFTPAVGILSAAGFGTSAQTLQSLASLQDATPRLS